MNSILKAYDPELFSKALPCLSAIGCALSPDYSHILSIQDQNNMWNSGDLKRVSNEIQAIRVDLYEPLPTDTSK
jgi:hypothetical protein